MFPLLNETVKGKLRQMQRIIQTAMDVKVMRPGPADLTTGWQTYRGLGAYETRKL